MTARRPDRIRGSKVLVVGGSIAGCAAAIALRRSGCEVTVHERSAGALQHRGFGVMIPLLLRERLVAAGYLDPAMPVHRCVQRLWVVPDQGDPHGRVAWRQRFPAALVNWGLVWLALRSQIPDERYRTGSPAQQVTVSAGRPRVRLADGGRLDADLVVGADGYRSVSRHPVDPGASPRYAGYPLWRGNYPEDRLPSPLPAQFVRSVVTVCFDGGHAIFYLVPDAVPGRRRVNWACYGPADPTAHPGPAMPPGSVDAASRAALVRRAEATLPPYWAAVVAATRLDELSGQPVHDMGIERYTSGPIALTGDAATVTRPHTASGAVKALEDALALEVECARHPDWASALAEYDRERSAEGNEQVELGRRLGDAMVRRTAAWSTMSAADFQSWLAGVVTGHHFRYGC